MNVYIYTIYVHLYVISLTNLTKKNKNPRLNISPARKQETSLKKTWIHWCQWIVVGMACLSSASASGWPMRHEPHRSIRSALATTILKTNLDGGFLQWGYPTKHGFTLENPKEKWMIWGYPHFRKHLNGLNIFEFYIFGLRLRMPQKPRRIMIFTLEREHANDLPCQE